MKKLLVSILILSIFACKKATDKSDESRIDSTQKKTESINSNQSSISKKEALKQINDKILHTLKNKDYKKFTEFVHPEKGVRFSMYAFVDEKDDKRFSKADFEKYYPTKVLFTWGAQDGSGELYKATIKDYLENWVFSKDFTKSQYSQDTFQGRGNSLNNLQEVYPKHYFTENFIKGTEKYSEMDWATLRFVFEELQGKYYLIAVINDEWTI